MRYESKTFAQPTKKGPREYTKHDKQSFEMLWWFKLLYMNSCCSMLSLCVGVFALSLVDNIRDS